MVTRGRRRSWFGSLGTSMPLVTACDESIQSHNSHDTSESDNNNKQTHQWTQSLQSLSRSSEDTTETNGSIKTASSGGRTHGKKRVSITMPPKQQSALNLYRNSSMSALNDSFNNFSFDDHSHNHRNDGGHDLLTVRRHQETLSSNAQAMMNFLAHQQEHDIRLDDHNNNHHRPKLHRNHTASPKRVRPALGRRASLNSLPTFQRSSSALRGRGNKDNDAENNNNNKKEQRTASSPRKQRGLGRRASLTNLGRQSSTSSLASRGKKNAKETTTTTSSTNTQQQQQQRPPSRRRVRPTRRKSDSAQIEAQKLQVKHEEEAAARQSARNMMKVIAKLTMDQPPKTGSSRKLVIPSPRASKAGGSSCDTSTVNTCDVSMNSDE